jgi:DNA-binding NarL/FixJ family response regulator
MVTLAERARWLEDPPMSVGPALRGSDTAIHPWTGDPDVGLLTTRHRQVLNLLKTGLSEKEVGTVLKISSHTVHVYVKAIYRKLKVTSRGELLCLCLNRRVFNDVHGVLKLARVDN